MYWGYIIFGAGFDTDKLNGNLRVKRSKDLVVGGGHPCDAYKGDSLPVQATDPHDLWQIHHAILGTQGQHHCFWRAGAVTLKNQVILASEVVSNARNARSSGGKQQGKLSFPFVLGGDMILQQEETITLPQYSQVTLRRQSGERRNSFVCFNSECGNIIINIYREGTERARKVAAPGRSNREGMTGLDA